MGEFNDPRLGATPFQKLFNPDSPDNSPMSNFTGMIGSAMGVPTQRDRNIQYQNAVGDIQSQAMSELGRLREAGMTPEQALVKFVQTPAGQQWFARSDPAAINKLATDFLQSTRAPLQNQVVGGSLVQSNPNTPGQATVLHSEPKVGIVDNTMVDERTSKPMYQGSAPIHNVGGTAIDQRTQRPIHSEPMATNVPAGSQAMDARTGQPMMATPTTEVQSFDHFIGFLKDSPDRVKQLAEYQATPSAMLATGQTERGVNELIRLGVVTPEIAKKIQSGIIEIKPVKGGVDDKDVGYTILDKSQTGNPNYKPTVIMFDGAAQPGTPGPQTSRPPANMFMGAGTGAGADRLIQSVAGNVSGKLGEVAGKGSDVVAQQGHMDNLSAAVAGLASAMPGDRMLSAQAKAWAELVPTTGLLSEPPVLAIQKAIILRNNVEGMIAHYIAVRDGRGSHANRVDADKAITALQNVERLIPAADDMQRQLQIARKGGGLTDTGVIPRALSTGQAAVSDASAPAAPQAQAPNSPAPVNERAVLGQVPTMTHAQLDTLVNSGQIQTPAIQAAIVKRLNELIGKKGK